MVTSKGTNEMDESVKISLFSILQTGTISSTMRRKALSKIGSTPKKAL
mgnify:CR=1 FL=1|jgi:hypothetical protein